MILDFRKLLASANPQADGQSGAVAGPSTPQSSVEKLPIGNGPHLKVHFKNYANV